MLSSPMFLRLLALFVLLPVLELALLIQIGQWIGVLWTVALVLATGVLGAALAKWQGLRAWGAIQRELLARRSPAPVLLDGLLILVGGIILLTPGILTDIFGFAMLVPASRNAFKRALRRRLDRAAARGESGFTILLR